MATTAIPQASNDDLEHLRMLMIGQYVYGGLLAFVVLIAGVFSLGLFATANYTVTHEPPNILRAAFGLLMIMAVLFAVAFPAAILIAAGSIKNRRRHTFCLVIAALECLSVPLGTIVGVFTLIVLLRPSVKAIFDQHRQLPYGMPYNPPRY